MYLAIIAIFTTQILSEGRINALCLMKSHGTKNDTGEIIFANIKTKCIVLEKQDIKFKDILTNHRQQAFNIGAKFFSSLHIFVACTEIWLPLPS